MTNPERKQVLAVLASLRTENNDLTKRLASVISLIGAARQGQLAVELIIDEFEKKLK